MLVGRLRLAGISWWGIPVVSRGPPTISDQLNPPNFGDARLQLPHHEALRRSKISSSGAPRLQWSSLRGPSTHLPAISSTSWPVPFVGRPSGGHYTPPEAEIPPKAQKDYANVKGFRLFPTAHELTPLGL